MIVSHLPNRKPKISANEVLNDNDWGTISKVSKNGQARNFWSIGDTKEIIINGTVGQTKFDNLSIWAFIIGFDHNSEIEGSNTIHFQIGKSAQTAGVNICLVSDKYWAATSANYFNMYKSASNSGGWGSSYMRNTLLGNSNTPDSPLASSLMAALPDELRAVMNGVEKYTDNIGGGKNTASYVTATTDYLWLPAEFEVMGTRVRSNAAEQNYQAQYAFYIAGNSTIKYSHKSTTSPIGYWTRSVNVSASSSFCTATTEENGTSATSADYSLGIAPCFCV